VLELHHVAITVPDLDSAIEWYTNVLGLAVSRREAETDVDSTAIGLPGERVRLKGVELAITPGSRPVLELHEFLTPRGFAARRICDTGISHFAFYTNDIAAECARLQALGVTFNSAPQYIATGGLAGDWWAYFRDPWGNTLHLVAHTSTAPPPEDSCRL
jgi:catechol 2,3-dioxygenase-like lactoylglutathione lyase family enzyme